MTNPAAKSSTTKPTAKRSARPTACRANSRWKKYSGGVAKYRASEGKAVTLEARGPVDHTVQEVLGGLRSTCTYVGARTLKALSKCTTFVRVTQQINEVYGKAG